jgi:hypothetical protein
MTTTPTIPNPATWGPRRYEDNFPLEVHDLTVTYSGRNVYLTRNMDLGVIIDRGENGKEVDRVSCKTEDTGVVVVSLDVDGGEFDAVNYDLRVGGDPVELLTHTIETLTASRDALRRVQQA